MDVKKITLVEWLRAFIPREKDRRKPVPWDESPWWEFKGQPKYDYRYMTNYVQVCFKLAALKVFLRHGLRLIVMDACSVSGWGIVGHEFWHDDYQANDFGYYGTPEADALFFSTIHAMLPNSVVIMSNEKADGVEKILGRCLWVTRDDELHLLHAHVKHGKKTNDNLIVCEEGK